MEVKETAIEVKYNKDYSIFQANELIRSKQDELTILEARLVRLAISQVVREDTDFRTYKCSIADLAKFLGINKDNIYKEAQTFSQNLMRKTIRINSREGGKKKDKYKLIHWVSSVVYEEGEITFKLSEDLKPYLLGLDELFTRYGFNDILSLPTNYAIRLFELLQSFGNYTVRDYPAQNYTSIELEEGEVIFTVDYLRNYFNCEDKYPNTSDFIKRVIDSSINAINKETAMRATYRVIKKGRSIKYVVFNPYNREKPFTPEQIKRITEYKGGLE